MSQKPDLKEEIESLINYFKDTRKLTVPEAVVVMLNSIAYLIGMDQAAQKGEIRWGVTPFLKEPPKPD